MLYSDAIKYLCELQLFGAKLGLETTFKLAALAGNPQRQLRFIHVAGTNGKGSTCAMLESIYRAAGLRVGLFTSPHLVSFAERIQVDRRLISEAEVARRVGEIKSLVESFSLSSAPEACPTFFEVVTVIALQYFAEQRCDLVIWETGLGGRLDATNIVTPLASVITNVQFDHQKWLGDTLQQIAREKSGIIKPGVPVISGAEDPSALQVIAQTARQCEAPLTVVARSEASALQNVQIPLLGEHQRLNAAVALATIRALADKIPVSDSAIRRGLETVDWAGRLQLIKRRVGQTVLLDGAHNPAGAQTLANALRKYFAQANPALVLGIMRDKDWPTICRILAPVASRIYLSPVGCERTADPQLLVQTCREFNPRARISVHESLAAACAACAAEEFVVITGSLYFIGEAIELLQLAPPSRERRLNEWTGATGVASDAP